jgi:hypothetical protein
MKFDNVFSLEDKKTQSIINFNAKANAIISITQFPQPFQTFFK